jgi:hypothetical protein
VVTTPPTIVVLVFCSIVVEKYEEQSAVPGRVGKAVALTALKQLFALQPEEILVAETISAA